MVRNVAVGAWLQWWCRGCGPCRSRRGVALSQDEADLLGDRICIMAEGRLQCAGSSHFLKVRACTLLVGLLGLR